jgi:hypothetical protein
MNLNVEPEFTPTNLSDIDLPLLERLPEIGADREYLLCGVCSRNEQRDVDLDQLHINHYLETLLEKEPLTFSMVNELAGSVAPMHPDCRISVNIPAYNEERVIARALDAYLTQDLPSECYEINVLVNSKQGEVLDETAQIARSIARDSPVPINVFEAEFAPENANVGFARKILMDIALFRARSRLEYSAPLYIQHDDADIYEISPDHLSRVVATFDANPHLDSVIRKLRPDRECTHVHDGYAWERAINIGTYLGFFRKCRQLVSHSISPDTGFSRAQSFLRPIGTGCSTAVTAEAHALICNGFGSAKKGEDLELGLKLAALRGHFQEDGNLVVSYDNLRHIGTRATWDPRRSTRNLYLAVEEANFVRYQYADFADQKTLEEVRSGDTEALLFGRLLGKYADFSALSDEEIKSFVTGLVSFHQRNLEAIIDSSAELGEELLVRYASFLSTYFAGREGVFRYVDDVVQLVEVTPEIRYRQASEK